jgi:hypothetical protein
MSRSLTFLHTSPVHVQTFDELVAELAPDIPVRHIVDASLLQEACAAGVVTPELARRIQAIILDAVAAGAAVVLCTCSTIGGRAERVGAESGETVLRIDRPMADRAVALGDRIVVLAALPSTIGPTSELLQDAAWQAGKEIEILEILCESAWARFEQGDGTGYLQEIAARIQEGCLMGDVIVLAQASMAGAITLVPDLPIPVLSSPRLGLDAAISAYRLATNA